VQIPNWLAEESTGSTNDNPFALPDAYAASQHKNVCLLGYLSKYFNSFYASID
jgi:hypothetical protein